MKRLAKPIKTLAAVSLATLLGMFAMASIDAESAPMSPSKPVSLEALMGKMESLQMQLNDNTRATEAMRTALDHQRRANARLISLLGVRSVDAGVVPPAVMSSTALSPEPPAPPLRLKMAIELCGKIGKVLEAKLAQKLSGEGDLKGFIGLDAFGNGALAKLEVKAGLESGFELGPEAGLEAAACIQGLEFELDTVTSQTLITALSQGAPQIASDITNLYMNSPLMHTANLTGPLNAMQNLQLNIGSGQIVNGLKQPASMFQDFQSLASTLPFTGNIGSVISNPGSLFPSINDFDPNAICGNVQAGTLFGDLCGRAQSFTSPLTPLTQTLSSIDSKVDNFINGLNGVTSNVTTLINDVGTLNVDFSNLTGKVGSLESGVTNLCAGMNSRFTTIRNGIVSFPARNFSLDLGPVGTYSIPVDILRNDQPYAGLSGVTCPTF